MPQAAVRALAGVAVRTRTVGDDAGILGAGGLDVALHACALAFADRRTDLSVGVGRVADRHRADDGFECVEEDRGGFPAELEGHPPQVVPAQGGDTAPSGCRAGPGDRVDPAVGHQVLADLPVGGHHVDHAVGNPCLGQQLRQQVGVEGASGAGFSTTEAPVRSADVSFMIEISSGAFHGTTVATTPTGSRGTSARRPAWNATA